MEKLNKYWLEIIGSILMLFFFIYVVPFLINLFNELYINSKTTECHEIYGSFGSYVGGVFGTIIGFLTLILVYKTYTSQRNELKIQKELISQQQFESTFFNMLNVHRELKNNLSLDSSSSIFYDPETNYEKLYYNFYYKKPDLNDKNQEEARRDKLSKVMKIGISVFGIIRNDYKNLNDSISVDERINLLKSNNLIQSTNRTLLSKLEALKNSLNNKSSLNETFEILFDKYQELLSHYCRNIYHILKFIRETEEQNKISYRKYADIFQSQLNVDEQFLLFYNFIHFNDEKNGIYSTINLVNHYQFLENVGIDNLIFKKHEEFYDFVIKGSDRKIEKK